MLRDQSIFAVYAMYRKLHICSYKTHEQNSCSVVARCITAAIANARNVLNQVLAWYLSDIEPNGKDLKAKYFAICV